MGGLTSYMTPENFNKLFTWGVVRYSMWPHQVLWFVLVSCHKIFLNMPLKMSIQKEVAWNAVFFFFGYLLYTLIVSNTKKIILGGWQSLNCFDTKWNNKLNPFKHIAYWKFPFNKNRYIKSMNTFFGGVQVINRPGVARDVLQTPLWFTD